MRWLSIPLVASVTLAARLAHGEDIEHARQLFEQASRLREAGDYAEAVTKLRQAIAIKDTPGLEYHAGFCEAKLGHFRLAIRYFERAAVLLRHGASAPDVVSLLPPAYSAALEHVAKVRIVLSGNPPSPGLRLDDEAEQPLSDADLLVDPGNHRLLVTAAGFEPEARRISVTQGQQVRIDVRLNPRSANAPPLEPATTSHFPWKSVSIGASLGVTVVGAGVGIASAVARHNAQGRADLYSNVLATCDTSATCPATQRLQTQTDLLQATNDKQSATRWETIGFIAAGAGAVTTLALWSLWPASHPVSVAVVLPARAQADSGLYVSVPF